MHRSRTGGLPVGKLFNFFAKTLLHFTKFPRMFRATTQMGHGQAVRQRFLVSSFPGSNPGAPAKRTRSDFPVGFFILIFKIADQGHEV